MEHLAAILYPPFDPVALRIGPVSVRWYGLAYAAAFVLAYLLLARMSRRGLLRVPVAALGDLIGWLAVGVIVGGRAGWWLFYHRGGGPEPLYEPVAIWHGGMSFHGGLAGVAVALLLWSWRSGAPFWNLADCAALVAPLGLLLGRVANFVNAELVGRPTDAPWGVVFPGDTFARHPSQLYEGVLEGPVLLACLWAAGRLLRLRDGRLAALFLVLYGAFRFGVEFTREPDPQLGFIALGWLTMGQVLQRGPSRCRPSRLLLANPSTSMDPSNRNNIWPAAPRAVVVLALALSLGGCVLAPPGTREEQRRLDAAGRPYEPPVERRSVPELPPQPTWRDVLQRAFLANGDLEAAYFDWKASMARIPQVATYPNTNLAPSFSYMFSGGRMKAWDRTTVNVGFDPMENLSFPTKVAAAGRGRAGAGAGVRQAVRGPEVRASAEGADGLPRTGPARGEDSRPDGQRVPAEAASPTPPPTGYVPAATSRTCSGRRPSTGWPRTNWRRCGRSTWRCGRCSTACSARPHDAPLDLPPGLPEPRPVAVDDARLIAAATDASPELGRLARDVAGRTDALELARMGFIPDINPFAAFTGGVSQTVGAMLIIPTTIPEIRGRIDEARAMLRASEAMLRQARSDRAASFVAALYVMRNSERQVEVFRTTILPRAEQAMASSRQAYATGQGTFTDLIDAQRTLLDVRLMIAEARVEREKRLAELESIAGRGHRDARAADDRPHH